MKILNFLPFVIDDLNNIGLAKEGTFAATAWLISDEAFKGVRGSKFSWIAPNGQLYTDDKSCFSRPSEQQIIANITPEVIKIAIEAGYIQE